MEVVPMGNTTYLSKDFAVASGIAATPSLPVVDSISSCMVTLLVPSQPHVPSPGGLSPTSVVPRPLAASAVLPYTSHPTLSHMPCQPTPPAASLPGPIDGPSPPGSAGTPCPSPIDCAVCALLGLACRMYGLIRIYTHDKSRQCTPPPFPQAPPRRGRGIFPTYATCICIPKDCSHLFPV